jgi:HSP20 family protein
MALMRYDQFRDLDRLSEQLWGRRPGRIAELPMDAYRRGDRFIMSIDLPGVDPDSIDVTVEQNVLTVRAERSVSMDEQDEVLIAERPQGSFSRQVFLGENLDPDHISANYEHGVLTLSIPVAERAKPKKVAVTAGEERHAVSAGAGRGDGNPGSQ